MRLGLRYVGAYCMVWYGGCTVAHEVRHRTIVRRVRARASVHVCIHGLLACLPGEADGVDEVGVRD
jgi:hypothetical protein